MYALVLIEKTGSGKNVQNLRGLAVSLLGQLVAAVKKHTLQAEVNIIVFSMS